jgi:uncharacterized membrane protein YdfJ with MMPL/SSD domain
MIRRVRGGGSSGGDRGPLGRLAGFTYRRRRGVLAVALVVLAAAGVAAASIFDAVEPYGFEDPDSEGARGYERYEQATGTHATPEIVVLVEPGGNVRAGPARERVNEVALALRQVPGVARVVRPDLDDPASVSSDGRATLVLGFIDSDVDDVTDVGQSAVEALGGRPGVTVGGTAVASDQINEQTAEDLARVELFAVPILLLLCFWVFRSVVAALVPVALGAVAITGALAAMRGLAGPVDIDVFSINIVTGLGLGLAIDYSLFVVSRYREELERFGPGEKALGATLRTAGRTVAFSGLIVAMALAALLVFPQRFLYSIGIGGALVALFSTLVALTVLPALLSVLGPRINALAPPRLQRAERPSPATGSEVRGGWYRWANFVMRRPVPIAAGAAALMIAAGVPFLDTEFTLADARLLPEERSSREVDDALRGRFSPGTTNPMIVVLNAPPDEETEAALRPAIAEASALPGVERVVGPRALGGAAMEIDVSAAVDPLSDRGQALLQDVRAIEWPYPRLVTGRAADLADQKQSLGDHLPLAVAIIVVTTFVAIFLMTGSVVLPVKALVMNLLTISAAFGIIVVIFQDGRLEGLLDYTSQGALDTSIPVLLFAVAFGLSTDYGVFLIARIMEARDAGASNREAVARGLDRTGRLVTAAALIFAVAVGAFVASELAYVKEIAVGLALAVLLDATVVRAMLVPALMQLLGRWNWWAPAPLLRLRRTRSA